MSSSCILSEEVFYCAHYENMCKLPDYLCHHQTRCNFQCDPFALVQRTPTSVTLASSNTSTPTDPVTFDITFTSADFSGRPQMRRLLQDSIPLGGQNISVSSGDGSAIMVVTTAPNGTASIVHTYAALGTYNATATYAGNVSS